VEILWWLAPAGGVLVLASLWATWAGRPQREPEGRSEEAYEKFVAAMNREHPAAGKPRPVAAPDRSTGIAVRPSSR
jgi:hypothetical protein